MDAIGNEIECAPGYRRKTLSLHFFFILSRGDTHATSRVFYFPFFYVVFFLILFSRADIQVRQTRETFTQEIIYVLNIYGVIFVAHQGYQWRTISDAS